MSIHNPGTRLNQHDKLFTGDVYYVDNAMDDNTGSGLSPEAAKKTITAAITAAAVSGDSITITRGDTASIALTDIGSLADWDKIYFTVKNVLSDLDSASVIMIEKTDGLKYIDGGVAVTAANGSMVIDDEPTGDITITIAASESLKLDGGAYYWDVQIIRSAGVPVSTLVEGMFIITADTTRAVT